MTRALFHFTCDHGHLGIGARGTLLPAHSLSDRVDWPEHLWQGRLVWATDLAVPQREALGLTSHLLKCDRTAHRYRLDHPGLLTPWHEYRRLLLGNGLDRALVEELEDYGARPMHWWVSALPQDVTYAPFLGVRA